MNLLKGLLGNGSLLNKAMPLIREKMTSENISCILVTLNPNSDGDYPGLEIKMFNGPIGILDGQDLEEYDKFRRDQAEQSIDLGPELPFAPDGKKEDSL